MTLSPLSHKLHATLSQARVRQQLSWSELSKALHSRGWEISPGNLATRHSRMAFRADELLLLMQALGIKAIDQDGEERATETG